MAVSLIPILIILGILVVIFAGVVVVSRSQKQRVAQVEQPGTDTLRYRVPEGQDPLAVLSALQQAGYDAVTEGEDVVVPVAAGDRERVRSVIEGSAYNLDTDVGPDRRVRFADE